MIPPKLRFILIEILVVIIVSEISLRLLGFAPFARIVKLPTQYVDPDPEIGWINKTGQYLVTPSAATRPERSMKILEDLSRNTNNSHTNSTKHIEIFGCSFTHGGEYIRDTETYPAHIQEKIVGTKVRNFGVIGYSSYQMLLLMKRVLHDKLNSDDVVIYGLVDFHRPRNVVTADWLHGMTNKSSTQLSIPYLLNDEKTVTSGMDQWTRFPLDDVSSLISLLEFSYGSYRRTKREKYLYPTLLYIIEEMRKFVVSKGGSFKVAYLAALNEKKEILISSIRSLGISTIDCIPNGDYNAYANPEDRHPNKLLHKYWGECLTNSLS